MKKIKEIEVWENKILIFFPILCVGFVFMGVAIIGNLPLWKIIPAGVAFFVGGGLYYNIINEKLHPKKRVYQVIK